MGPRVGCTQKWEGSGSSPGENTSCVVPCVRVCVHACVRVCVCVRVRVCVHLCARLRMRARVRACACVWVTQSCLTLCGYMDCSPPGSSVLGVLQARILEWVAMPFFRGSSQFRDRTQLSCSAGRLFVV